MEFNPLVSIIIPVYNGSDYLAQAIQSALEQTYKNCEIIVINDGSNDNGATRKVALSYGEQIRYFEKENGGVSSAFNFGIRTMNGEYFSWLSHDDMYFKDKLEVQIEILKNIKDKNTVLFSEYALVDNNSEIIGKSNINFRNCEFLDLYLVFKRPFINGNTILVSNAVLKEIGIFDNELRFTQDYDMWFRIARKYQFMFLKKELIKSRIHKTQGSKINKNFKKDSLKLKIKQIEFITNQKLLSFTKSNSLAVCYFKLLLFSFYQGGELNEYPMNIWVEKLSKIPMNWYYKKIVILVSNVLVKTTDIPNRIRRIIVKTIFIFSNSPLKKMFLSRGY